MVRRRRRRTSPSSSPPPWSRSSTPSTIGTHHHHAPSWNLPILPELCVWPRRRVRPPLELCIGFIVWHSESCRPPGFALIICFGLHFPASLQIQTLKHGFPPEFSRQNSSNHKSAVHFSANTIPVVVFMIFLLRFTGRYCSRGRYTVPKIIWNPRIKTKTVTDDQSTVHMSGTKVRHIPLLQPSQAWLYAEFGDSVEDGGGQWHYCNKLEFRSVREANLAPAIGLCCAGTYFRINFTLYFKGDSNIFTATCRHYDRYRIYNIFRPVYT